MNLLILPKRNISFHHLWSKSGFPSFDLRKWKEYTSFSQVAYEWLYYSDIVKVNAGTTAIVGDLHPQYLKAPSADTTNPSAHLSPHYSGITVREALKDAKEFDVLLCSIEAARENHPVYKKCLEIGVKVAIVDHPDHEAIYLSKDVSELTYGLRHGVDFNFYFKKDLPLGWNDIKGVLPLGPDPIRMECFAGNRGTVPQLEHQVFFSGILNKPITRENRKALLEAFRSENGSRLNVIDVADHYGKRLPLTNDELFIAMQSSRFILSPAGRSWTTTRHTMTAAANSCPILPSPDCEIVGPKIADMEHAIVYPMLRYLSESDAAVEANILASRVRETDEKTRLQIASNWADFVKKYHTTEARAQYILEAINA